MLKIGVLLLLLIPFSSHAAGISDCKQCHHIEKIDSAHNFRCVLCHVLPKDRISIHSHKNIIKNPSSLKYASILCGKCHKKDIDNLTGSLHGTLAGAIAITRFIWGAQKSTKPEYAIKATGSLKELKIDGKPNSKPSSLVNDFLRRKCLRCHLYNNGTDAGVGSVGLYRSTGCAACHMKYAKEGIYDGKDRLLKGKKFYSETHRFYKVPPMNNCLACHNTEFVGTDYKGLFPHDSAHSFNSPILSSGNFPATLYGTEFHHLTSDIHYRKGLSCVDCHKKSDAMGDGNSYYSEMQKGAVKANCADCHGGFVKKPDSRWVKYRKGIYRYKSVKGKIYNVKQFKAVLVHKSFHKKLACSACHSAWQNENYGLNNIRDDGSEYEIWKNLASEDPYLEDFLTKALKNSNRNGKIPQPEMPDRVTGKMHKGIWYSEWIMRRWSYFTLGITNYGKIKILRPLFEYRLSYKDADGNLIISNTNKSGNKEMSGFVPYDPHTTTLYGKSCAMCHENRYVLNKKRLLKEGVMKLLYGKVINGGNLPKEVQRKMQSMFYKKTAAGMFYKGKW